jgi:hypothetical protein
VAAITQVRTGAASRDSEVLADRARQQAQTAGLAETVDYVAEMRRTASVRKNPKAFE